MTETTNPKCTCGVEVEDLAEGSYAVCRFCGEVWQFVGGAWSPISEMTLYNLPPEVRDALLARVRLVHLARTMLEFGAPLFDRAGKQITPQEWLNLNTHPERRVVGYDEHQDVTVSTAWLGLDMSLGEQQPPLIFETLCVRRLENGSREELGSWAYPTELEALRGHERAVIAVKNGWRGDALPEPLAEVTLSPWLAEGRARAVRRQARRPPSSFAP